MAALLTLDDLGDIAGQTATVRVDFNVPLSADGIVIDDTRLRSSLPTVTALSRQNAVVLLLSHLGRPKGSPQTKYSLRPVASAYARLLDREVQFIEDWAKESGRRAIASLNPGDIAVLENTRFYAGEEGNDPHLAAIMAGFSDFYINDAFSAAHRAHASTAGIAQLLPSYAGRALQAELVALGAPMDRWQDPSVAIIGGAKISTKIDVLERLISKADTLIIGGAMANTFLAALGEKVGKSLFEPHLAGAAQNIMDKANNQSCRIYLPTDVVVAFELSAQAASLRTSPVHEVNADEMILDLGPRSIAAISEILNESKFVIWNGPLGAFEVPPFGHATAAIALVIADRTRKGALTSLAGGGDTLAALNKSGLRGEMSYVSTGGGAFLDWIAGKRLPALEALSAAS